MLKADPVPDLRLCLGHRSTEIDAPNRMFLAAIVLQRHEIAVAVLRVMLIGRGPVLDQATRIAIGKLVLCRIELRAVAMPGHGDIGQMPVHRARRHHKGAVHRRALVLVNRRRITVVDGAIIICRYTDAARILPRPHRAVEPRGQTTRLDGLDRAKHPVLDAKIAVILQKHDTVAGRELALAVIGLECQLSTFLAASQPMAVLQGRSDRVVDGANIGPAMRHRNARAVWPLVAIGKVVPHDLAARLVPRFAKPNVPIIPVGGQALGRPVRGEVNGRLPLPVHALPANLRKLGMADLLGNGAERCAGPDRLELFMITNEHDLRPTLLGLVDEPGELPASDHTRLVDDEHVAAVKSAAVGIGVATRLPAIFVRRERAALDAGTFLQPLGRLARQGRAVNRITLRLPCLAPPRASCFCLRRHSRQPPRSALAR